MISLVWRVCVSYLKVEGARGGNTHVANVASERRVKNGRLKGWGGGGQVGPCVHVLDRKGL